MEEIFKDIPGYDGEYKVSNLGRVLSFKNINPKIISPQGCSKRNGKYRYLSIKLSKNGVVKRIRIHQLVAMAFLNYEINNDFIVDHINNNSFDNRLENLQITTQRINQSKDRRNKTGYTGIRKTNSGKYQCRISVNKKVINLGYFTDKKEAFDFRCKYIKDNNLQKLLKNV